MSGAPADAQDAAESRQVASSRWPCIELVSTTGVRDLGVLVYRSPDLDETAFAPLEPVSARVYGLAVRIAPDTPTEVVVLNACHEVWRISTRFDADRSSAIAWIMAIAHRRAVDRLRSTRDTNSSLTPFTPLPSSGRRARRNAHQDRHSRQDRATHAEAAQVRDALAQLGPDQRDALELVSFERYLAAGAPDALAAIMSTVVTTSVRHDPEERSAPAPGLTGVAARLRGILSPAGHQDSTPSSSRRLSGGVR